MTVKMLLLAGGLGAGAAAGPITHRLASVRHADLIHVLEEGRLRESGTFEELLHKPTAGVFRELYEMQRAQFQDAALPGRRNPADAMEGNDAR